MASRRARSCRWVCRSAGGQVVASSRKSGRMSIVSFIFLLAAGQDAQRVVDRGIPSNSFLLEEGMKTPRKLVPGGFGFVGREQGAALFPYLRSWQELLSGFLPRCHHRRASDVVIWPQHRSGEECGKRIGGQAAQLAFLVDPHQAAIRQVDALQPAVDQFVQFTGRKACRPVFRVYLSNASRGSNQQRHGYLLSFSAKQSPQKTVFWGMSFNRRGCCQEEE